MFAPGKGKSYWMLLFTLCTCRLLIIDLIFSYDKSECLILYQSVNENQKQPLPLISHSLFSSLLDREKKSGKAKLIDSILINRPQRYEPSGVFPPDFSKHCCVICTPVVLGLPRQFLIQTWP